MKREWKSGKKEFSIVLANVELPVGGEPQKAVMNMVLKLME